MFPVVFRRRINVAIFILLLINIASILVRRSCPGNNIEAKWHSFEMHSKNEIPRNIHFIIGLGDQPAVKQLFRRSTPFALINYLNFLAARRQIQPEKIYVHYYEEPNTFWWNQTKNDREIDMILVKARSVHEIFGRPVDNHAHRADILRLEILMKYGGIYLDSDVLALNPFDSLLNFSDVVMAREGNEASTLCNAVILAKPNAIFLRRWYEAYQSFDQRCWSCHSVAVPGRLSLIYKSEIKVLPTSTFFRPSWNDRKAFFQSNDYNFSSNYASHLWNKEYHARFVNLTVEKVLYGNFTLASMIRHAIGTSTLIELQKYSNGTSLS